MAVAGSPFRDRVPGGEMAGPQIVAGVVGNEFEAGAADARADRQGRPFNSSA